MPSTPATNTVTKSDQVCHLRRSLASCNVGAPSRDGWAGPPLAGTQ